MELNARMRRVTKPRPGTERQAPPEVLLRGLSVLEALNCRPISSVDQLAVQTGLPKATVVRILHNLATRGYVQHLPLRKGYMLGERVLNLSNGYRSHDSVVEAARPQIAAFTLKYKWPVSLATLEIDSMRVRVSSSAESPFATATDRARLNRRVPLLASALGWAYLAFCPDDEREIIVSLLRASQRPDDLAARDAHYVDATVRAIRRAGYAVSPSLRNDPAIGLAVPILSADRVLATISLRYLGKAISEAEVARRFLRLLRGLAEAIVDDAEKR